MGNGQPSKQAIMNPKQIREALQHKYGLRVLRIYMDNAAQDKPLAVFTLIQRDGSETGLLTASLPELGFDTQRREGAYACLALPATYLIPKHIVAAIRGWLMEDIVAEEPLWLRLSMPLGLLAAVPWEELLQPALNVPILRLPYQSICPRQPPAQSNTVVCFSSPSDEPDLQTRVDAFVSQVPQDLARATQFHLFGDRAAYPALQALQEKHAGSVSMKVYDPAGAPTPGSLLSGNPWLRWIEMTMGEGRVDVVHFLCHSRYQSESGALKLSSAPGDAPDSVHPCLLYAAELINFLNYVGAWCAAFTSAPAEQSAAGMRMLQTEIARRRPGPLLVHDMNVADSAAALGDAYRFLFSSNRLPPASPAVALYCHPILMAEQGIDEESNKQLTEFTLDGRLRSELHGDSLPGWVLSSQRKLEVTAGFLADAQAQDQESGRVRARKLVLDAVTDYARATAQGAAAGEEQ
jgi:hypothetical protein